MLTNLGVRKHTVHLLIRHAATTSNDAVRLGRSVMNK